MAGNSGVPHRSIAVMSVAGWQIAGRMARHVTRAPGARDVLAPLPSSRDRARQRTVAGLWQDRAEPVLPYRSRARRGLFGGGVNDGRADRISKVGHYPAHVRRGEWRASAAAGRWLSGVPSRVPGQQRDNEMQQDSAGLDGT